MSGDRLIHRVPVVPNTLAIFAWMFSLQGAFNSEVWQGHPSEVCDVKKATRGVYCTNIVVEKIIIWKLLRHFLRVYM